MFNRLFNLTITRVALLVGALMAISFVALPVYNLAFAQATDTIEYAENGTDPVATFTATDPEGATPIVWSLLTTGTPGDIVAGDYADSEDFMIDSEDGVLKFSISDTNDGSSPGSPDFENPQGAGSPLNNTYNVVVAACDVSATDCTGGQTGYHKVTVKVTNVEETGKVTWTVDPDGDGDLVVANVNGGMPIVQFQVGATLAVLGTGGVTDGDVSGDTKDVTERLQWYRSSSKTGMGTAIEDATNATYPVTTDDIGMYLRVEAFYNVSTGREESASLTSDYPVLASRTSNDEPEFSPASVTREVSEGDKGMIVGALVTATDDITNALNYVLSGDATDSPDAAKFKIDQKTGQITTAVDLNRESEEADNDNDCGTDFECVVQVIATDSAGTASDPVATVTITLKNVDEKPTFSTGFKMRDVAEGMTQVDDDAVATNAPMGEAIYDAMDPDGQSLTYRLMGPDGAKFQLSASRSLSFRMKPDYEMPTDANKDNVYGVTVRASDGTMYADRMVMVTVTPVDEGPEIMGRDSVDYAENGKDPVATFTATDPEGATPIVWSLLTTGTPGDIVAGDYADSEDFMIDSEDGVLKFSISDTNDGSSPGSPDFENPQGAGSPLNNTYNVVVAACDVSATDCTGGQTGYHKVTVKVTTVAETGEVTWTTDADADNVADDPTLVQFQVGSLLTATATDGDITGGTKTVITAEHNLTWGWYRGSTRITGNDAEDNTYTVTTTDVGSRLRVMAFYTVGTGREESASLTSDYPVLASRTNNDEPEFSPASVTREVSEGDKGMTVGAPVRATDDITNALNYVLAGADTARFKIDQKTGQITTLADLDREGETMATATDSGSCADARAGSPDTECIVTVMATDSAGSDSTVATVTINITNVDEKPKFTSGYKMASIAEGTTVVDTDADNNNDPTTGQSVYEAMDEDGLNVNLALMGSDAAKFSLGSDGVLSFRMKPDYEMPSDANRDNVYMVTVRASDGTLHEDRMVMVNVSNVDEAPEIIQGGLAIRGMSSVQRDEGSSRAVATYTASGPNAARASWTLSGTDAGDFSIGSTSGVLTFRAAPDFDAPTDANGDNVYMVTVKATDGTHMAERNVTVTVTEVDDGTVTPMPGTLPTEFVKFDDDGNGMLEEGEVVNAVIDHVRGRDYTETEIVSLVVYFVSQPGN